jgi:DNA-binding NarL/FixJ family response regulator
MPEKTMVIIDAQASLYTLRVALEQRYNTSVTHVNDAEAVLELVRNTPPDYILVNPHSVRSDVAEFLMDLAKVTDDIPVIIAGSEEMRIRLRSVYTQVIGCVPEFYSENDLLPFLQPQRSTQPAPSVRSRALAERATLVQTNQLLEQRVQEMVTLYQIGRAVASLTDLDAILARIVEAAVFLLHSDESSILLRDPNTNELFLRAQKGLGENHARGFNLKIEDTLIGSVVQTMQAVRMARGVDTDDRLKVATGYLVNALLYVPLAVRGEVIGVLGVANEKANRAFGQHDQRLLEVLGDYAALAIKVAHQHKDLQRWREESEASLGIAESVAAIRERVGTDDDEVLSALLHIEGAAQNLARLAETEAPLDV